MLLRWLGRGQRLSRFRRSDETILAAARRVALAGCQVQGGISVVVDGCSRNECGYSSRKSRAVVAGQRAKEAMSNGEEALYGTNRVP